MISGSAAARSGLSRRSSAARSVQRLTPALEEAVVGSVLDQRMLEAIAGCGRRALDKQEVGVCKPFKGRLYGHLIGFRDGGQE
jgi:hypothetical protein